MCYQPFCSKRLKRNIVLSTVIWIIDNRSLRIKLCLSKQIIHLQQLKVLLKTETFLNENPRDVNHVKIICDAILYIFPSCVTRQAMCFNFQSSIFYKAFENWIKCSSVHKALVQNPEYSVILSYVVTFETFLRMQNPIYYL